VLLVTWRHWVPPLLAVGFGASTLGAFVIATTVGLMGVHDKWSGGYVWSAAVAEVVAAVAGLLLLLRDPPVVLRGQLQHRPAVRGPHLH
jgi:hypothetical protein